MTRLPCLVLSLTALLVTAAAGSGQTVRTVAEKVEVRREASASAAIHGSVPKGTVFQVLGREPGWIKVAYPIGNDAFYAGFVPEVFCEDAKGAAPSTLAPAAPPSAPSPSATDAGRGNAPAPVQPTTASISSARPPAMPATRTGGPMRVCVSPPRPEGGFVDTSKDIQDSVKDIEKRLNGRQGLILECTDADVILVVAGRGVGSESLGYVAGFAADSQGAAGAVVERRQVGQWVATGLYARDGADYQLVKKMLGSNAYEESNAMNPYASLGGVGGWGECAKQIAKDVVEWVTANRAELMARRVARP